MSRIATYMYNELYRPESVEPEQWLRRGDARRFATQDSLRAPVVISCISSRDADDAIGINCISVVGASSTVAMRGIA